jgi:hypothetical protein
MKISAKSDLKQETAEIQALSVWTVQESRRKVRSVSLTAERRVKDEMPKRTGRAAGSWGHWTPGDISANPDASSADAVWEVSDNGFTITQGSNVEYVEALNDGHSRQAPAGFIDAAEAQSQRELDREIEWIMGRWR